MRLIFLGPPGAGKGTQAARVCAAYGIPQISTGEILRAAIANQTEIGMKAKSFIDAGQLVPDDVVIEIVRQRLQDDDCRKGFILDGFPRTVAQAEALLSFADIDLVISLELPDDEVVRRLGGRRVCPDCGATYNVELLGGKEVCALCEAPLVVRNDDSEATIRNRLAVYERQTAPLIDFFAERGMLYSVSGLIGLENVTSEICKAIQQAIGD